MSSRAAIKKNLLKFAKASKRRQYKMPYFTRKFIQMANGYLGRILQGREQGGPNPVSDAVLISEQNLETR